jgi:hypothetical protein
VITIDDNSIFSVTLSEATGANDTRVVAIDDGVLLFIARRLAVLARFRQGGGNRSQEGVTLFGPDQDGVPSRRIAGDR